MNSIELFAGGGGLALGAAHAGFQHKTVLDSSPCAVETLIENKARGVAHVKDWDVRRADLTTFEFRELDGTADYIFGGPPCQPFSLAGKHRGGADERNMFPSAIRAVGDLQPRAFVFENVRGLLRGSFSRYYDYIRLHLRYPTLALRDGETWEEHLSRLRDVAASRLQPDVQYEVLAGLLNAADFGVPQHRWRVFIVGTRVDTKVEFTFPQPTHDEDALLFDKWVSGDYWERHRVPHRRRQRLPDWLRPRVDELRGALPILTRQPWRTVRDGIAGLPRIGLGQSSRRIDNHYLNPGARSYPGHTGSEYDEPAKTLKAGAHGVPGGENTLKRPDGTVRYFSVRECARLQSYPDDWTFIGTWCACMRLIGNAVPVSLAEAVARKLADAIRRTDARNEVNATTVACLAG